MVKPIIVKPILFFILVINTAFAQEYQTYLTQADSAYEKGSYAESAHLFTVAISKGASHPNSFYNAACSFALSGNKDSAFVFLEKAIAKGWRDVNLMQKDKDLNSLHSDPLWIEVVTKCQTALDFYEATLDKPLRHELLKMKEEDQALRKMVGSTPDTALWRKVQEVDQKNTARMKEIIQQYGWPGSSLVGEEGASAAWLLVQHADLDSEFQKFCLPLVTKAAKKGEATWKNVAYLTDRVLVGEGKKQIYGTQCRWNESTGKYEPSPIEDATNVDKRRKEVGLEPLSEYVKKLNKFNLQKKP